MLTLMHSGHSITLSPESMIIVKNATESDYLKLANEDLKVEFDGECLYIHSPATKRHEKLVFKFLKLFEAYFELNPEMGEALGSRFSIKLPNNKRPEPDVVVVPANSIEDTESIFEGKPLLIIEILSPSARDYDLNVKKEWFMDALVPEIWIVDYEQQIIINFFLDATGEYKSAEISDTVIESFVLPGFKVNVKDLFRKA